MTFLRWPVPVLPQLEKTYPHRRLAYFSGHRPLHQPMFDHCPSRRLCSPVLLWRRILLWYFFSMVTTGNLSTGEVAMMTLNVGIMVSTIGINVAHELGHRPTRYEQLLSKMLMQVN